jgi:diguanylate cyclase (GGDEF)-like protein
MRPAPPPTPPPDSVEPRARASGEPLAAPGTGPARPQPDAGRGGPGPPRASAEAVRTAQARADAGRERRGSGRAAATPPPRPDAEPEDTQPLPGTRPRIGLPILLPATGAAVILLAHGLLATLIYGLDWTPSLGMLLASSAATGLMVSVVLLSSAGTWLGRRIGKIIEVLERTQVGDYSQRVESGLHDDVGMLARRVNLLVSTSAAREKRIIESALSDPLTGLPNRTLLTERIRHSLAISRRARTPFCVAVVDLDRFKFINDTLGHAAGDTVLREVARRLRATVRETDTVARLGGDEFVLLLVGSEDAGREVCTRILAAMRTPLAHRDQLIDIGLSIGLSVHPQHGDDDVTLLRHADTAMYRAKRRGAGVEVFDGELYEVRRSYLSMLGELRTALQGRQLVLDYQPKLDLTSGLIVGVEGLVRWNHPTRGRVPPGEFIPFAEQTGFMREITPWVIAEGVRFAAEITTRGMLLNVSINVSAQDIENPALSGRVAEILAERKLDASRLTLEITESGLLSETENALSNLQSIAALGVRLSVDDFGTGYATLKQLQKLPVHELKIDRSFVSGMNTNRGNATIVRSTVDLAKQLGLRTIAEGVETVAELRALASMGCDEIQGYYLAKPMPAAEVITWVEMRHALYASSREAYFRTLVER